MAFSPHYPQPATVDCIDYLNVSDICLCKRSYSLDLVCLSVLLFMTTHKVTDEFLNEMLERSQLRQ